MSQILENKISRKPGLKEVILYFRQRQEGFAIIWIIGLIMAFATVGSVIVATYNLSSFGQLDATLSSKAESLAESGYRFFYSELKSQSNDEDKNRLIDELHSKTFNISPDGQDGQFELNMTSYFYRIETVTSGSELKVKFIGDPPVYTVPAAGYLRNIEDATIYQYSSQSSTGGVYTFNLSGGQTVPSTNLYTTVIPAAVINAFDAGTRTLTLSDSDQAALFPPENGVFLITKKALKANLPVTQNVPYKYEYRDGNQLFGIDKGPGVGYMPTIIPDEIAEVAKFVSLKSTGYTPDKADPIASESHDFNVSLDISASSAWHSSSGLKSYWSFDDAGTPGKDDYGTSAGTLTGGVTHTATGKVGGALEFSGAGYVGTTFNPRTAIGSKQSFTVVFWAKPNTVSGFQAVVGSGDWSLPSIGRFYIAIYWNKWLWGYGDLHGDYTSGLLPNATANQWQHIAYVYDKDLDDIIIYVNGIEKYRFEDYTWHGGSGLISDISIDIGGIHRQGELHDTNFDGTIDEIAIFSTALSICEIREIYDVPCNVGCGTFNTANDPGVFPVAYYPFNGNANDESGADKDGNPPDDNHGTVYNAVLAVDRFGCVDKAYSFDGVSAYIRGPNSDSLELSDVNRVTVGLWVKKASLFNTRKVAIVQKSDFSYVMRFDNNQHVFIIDQLVGKKVEATAPITVTAGVWYHVVGTFDGIDVKVYVDGYLKDSRRVDELSPGVYDTIGDGTNYGLGIGKNLRRRRHLEGAIDDVSIWDQALTAGQVLDYYNQTSHK